MGSEVGVVVTLPADVQQIDQTGYVWAFLDEAAAPDRVVQGALIVAGDSDEPFLARVVDVIDGPNGRSIYWSVGTERRASHWSISSGSKRRRCPHLM